MEISEVNPDGNVYQLKDATARTQIAELAAKEGYSETEIDTGTKWIDGSTIYKKTISIGALPNSASKNVSHGITGLKFLVSISGITYNPTAKYFFPLPFSETENSPISIQVNLTNVIISTHLDRRAFTIGYVTMLYTKD